MEQMRLRLGIFAAPWWIGSVLIFGYLEPNYSHLYHAVSKLGAFGAENAVGMNLFGFLATGSLVWVSYLSWYFTTSKNKKQERKR